MGILNVTPDSFSDGGHYFQLDKALYQAQRLLKEGADILDIGGESSRPGAVSIGKEEELARVIPIIERIRSEDEVCISIDTTKSEVMHAAVAAGAGFINDIMALRDEASLAAAAQLQVPVCLMHMRGVPLTMQAQPHYQKDVIEEINEDFAASIERCLAAGLPREYLVLDPGFGFGKTTHHNLKMVKHFAEFKQHNLPLMLGASRKSTLGMILNKPVNERLTGALVVNSIAVLNGAAIIRTHDVKETKQALLMVEAIRQAS